MGMPPKYLYEYNHLVCLEQLGSGALRRVPDIRFIIVNLDRYHTTNRPAARANEIRALQLAVLLVVW